VTMPRRSLYACHHPGCPESIREGRFCPAHEKKHQAEIDQRRGSAASRGYDARWRRLRKMYLAANPICVDPFNDHPGQVVLATDVDHKVSKSKGGTSRWDNLESLCHTCHSKKTAKEDGRWG